MTDRMHRLVFGEDVTLDENGKPIEKGSGNLTDRANPKPAANWPLDPTTARAAVFGANVQVDKDGKPIEKGIAHRNAAPNK